MSTQKSPVDVQELTEDYLATGVVSLDRFRQLTSDQATQALKTLKDYPAHVRAAMTRGTPSSRLNLLLNARSVDAHVSDAEIERMASGVYSRD